MKTTGNTILITGGGSGIGRALAEAFHKAGNEVIIAGRRQGALDEVVAANPGMHAAVLDIEDAAAIAAFAKDLTARFPALDAVIHNAGIMRTEKLIEGGLDTAEHTIATNLLGPIRLNDALLPHLLARPQASIITVSSGLAFLPLAATPTYSATKAAIHAYTMALRHQLKSTNVEVLELAPPYVQTELMGEQQASDPRAMPLAEFIDEVMAIIAQGPANGEILVERVKPLRNAEASGDYHGYFTKFNDAMAH
ncbi:MAG: DltE [Massilia sp.]|nr:DltE [Massilia sp.]